MCRVPLFAARAALVAALCATAAPALAQLQTNTQVAVKASRVRLWLRAPVQVVAELQPGTKLDVIDKEGDWLWVIVPPDANGTRRSGWVKSDSVEPILIRPAAMTSNDERRDTAPAAPEPAASGEDRVTIKVAETRAGEPARTAPSATPAPTFEDVHFDLNRSTLRSEDGEILRATAAAMQADPSLVVNIEGHTCNLGTAAYNQALGLRRANEVKEYLVREGIDESRLHTVSMGEANPEFDNSKEGTRKLNRRVAVVPEPRR